MKTKNMTTLHSGKSFDRSSLRLGLLLTFALACFALLPTVRAVTPPPDGGYPGNNTAEGDNALFSLTTGAGNTANGLDALFSTTTGSDNTAGGVDALRSNTTGTFNTADGVDALFRNTTGSENTATGNSALESNTKGDGNTATGVVALRDNSKGRDNTATGGAALLSNTIGNDNTANGSDALFNNTSGQSNTANGFRALVQNTTGNKNTADGNGALAHNTTGSRNIGIGTDGGENLTIGDHNIDIGNQGISGESGRIRIGNANQTATFIAGISGADAIGGEAVFVNSFGKFGTVNLPSSARFKEDIKRMNKASEAILALTPVSFRYKKELDTQSTPQFGLIAEDVAKVDPNLVKRDRDGKLQTVRYDAVNAMLLNEFLKEHRKVEEQEATIVELKSGMTALAATVKEQAAQIQKVSAQLEFNKTVPQIVLNNE